VEGRTSPAGGEAGPDRPNDVKYRELVEFLRMEKPDLYMLASAAEEFLDMLEDNVGAAVSTKSFVTLLTFVLAITCKNANYTPDIFYQFFEATYKYVSAGEGPNK